ncbi:MAG: hypothetical protein ACJ8J0_27405 [Longimicrobiaceae bacterium]
MFSHPLPASYAKPDHEHHGSARPALEPAGEFKSTVPALIGVG